MIDRQKLIVSCLPLLALVAEMVFAISEQLGNRETVLCLLLTFWMVSWWVFEVLPLGITALLPLVYVPVLGILPIKDVAPAYANPVIFLFLGGFMIARAMEKTNLDERIALNILKRTGRSDLGIIIGFILATTFLSMWISNTATTVMMVPIALSVTHFLNSNIKNAKGLGAFNTALFLSIAYSANIGGIMTPVGTPPNVVFMGYLNDIYGESIDFYRWILATAPVAIALLFVMLFLLRKVFPFHFNIPDDFSSFIDKQLKRLGKIDGPQRITIAMFLTAAFLWIFKGPIHWLSGEKFLNDTSIAIFAGLSLFLIPSQFKGWQPVLDKDDIGKLPWDIVLLFGGGMALAGSLKAVGVIQDATDFFAGLDLSSPYVLILMLAGLSLFLTEIMSNVALCVVALPLIMKLGESQGIDPILIAMPAALCTSFAFSMPISTPPNAIVFGTHAIRVSDMLKAGILLNFVALGLTMGVGFWLIKWIIL